MLLVVYFATASEPEKVVELTTGALIQAYFEKPRQWDTKSKLCFRFVQHSDSLSYKFSIIQINAA